MPKVWINDDAEWYPVHTLTGRYDGDEAVEVPDATLQDWKLVFAEFDRVQLEMRSAIKAAKALTIVSGQTIEAGRTEGL